MVRLLSSRLCVLTRLETLTNGVLITRLKSMPQGQYMTAKNIGWELQPALKVCVTSGLSKKDIERAGTTIRHAITKVMKSWK